jgi:hypothetical protein
MLLVCLQLGLRQAQSNVIKLRNNIIKQHADFADFNIFYNLFLQKYAESAGK